MLKLRFSVTTFFVVWLLFGCHTHVTKHVLATRSEMSRGYTYISFHELETPYQITEEVGGEYISNTKVVAYSNQRYRVEVSPKNDKVSVYVEGPGIQVDDVEGRFIKEAWVNEARETFIHISITAHPSEKVTLIVTPLEEMEP